MLSHPAGGTAESYGRELGAVMRTWGLVCIATNYTHARGIALKSPGQLLEHGASPTNVFGAHAAVRSLAGLGYVDRRRVAAWSQHGGLRHHRVRRSVSRRRPGGITHCGRVLPDAIHANGMPAPSVAQARRIKLPISGTMA